MTAKMPLKALLAVGASVLALTSLSTESNAAGDRVRSIELTADTQAANPNASQAAYLLADMWKKLGLDVKVKEVPYKQKLDTVYFDRSACEGAACFDMAMWSIVGRPERSDPDEVIYNLFHSSTGAKGYNYPGYANAEYDKAAAGQQVELDPKKRQELVWKAQEIQANDPSYIFFVNPIVNYAIRKDVFDEKTAVQQSGLGILNFWTHIGLTPTGAKKDIVLNTSDNLLNLVPMAIGGAAASWITDLVWDRMMRINPKGLPEPWAAESYKWVDDKTIDLTLRSGMKWHDGKPVTVDDVLFTFGEVGSMAPMYAPFLNIIAKVEKTGDRTVRMTLKTPSAPFLTSTLAKVNLTPAHIWRPVVADLKAKGQTLDSYQPEELIGSGPYKFTHWRRNAEVLLTANKDHWSPPKAERWILRIVPNMEATIGMLKQGEINFLSEYRGDFETLDKLAKDSGQIAIKSGVTIGVEYMGFNLKRMPMKDQAFRRALSLATDRELLAASAWKDQAVPTNAIVSTVLEYWHNPAVTKDMYNLDRAKEVLTKAGYSWVNGRLHYPDGVKDTVMAPK
ncbi:MAG: twin-arginine translocation pathway signal protein [Alphaproteobacteria bacterium]|nr:twin-arginine translocation pathway signal protein [Alphaproteobacteria bacterium]